MGDGCVAVSISASEPQNTKSKNIEEGIKVLAIRTIDPPSRISATAAGAGAGEGAREDGVWQPKRGGLGRKTVAKILRIVTEKGGVGEEVLSGMARFAA